MFWWFWRIWTFSPTLRWICPWISSLICCQWLCWEKSTTHRFWIFCFDRIFFLFFFVGLLPTDSLSNNTKVCSSSESDVGGSVGGLLVVYHALLAHCVQTHVIEPQVVFFFLIRRSIKVVVTKLLGETNPWEAILVGPQCQVYEENRKPD